MNEILFRVGGAAGDGVASTAETFARLCVRGGLYVHTYSSYQSVIRGGHGWTQVRASEAPVLSQGEDPNLVICLNQETANIHAPVVQVGGALLYDGSLVKVDGLTLRKDVRKVKGMSPGMVMLKRFRTVRVRAALPRGAAPEEAM